MNNYTFLKKKYSPKNLDDLYLNKNIILLLKNLVKINHLNILFVSNTETCKTTLINILVKYYYNNINIKSNENILYINSLKDNGISYYRNEVKIFCQTKSSIINKKKTIIIDDLDSINDQTQQIIRYYIDHYSKNINIISTCNNIQKILDSIQSRLDIIKINNVNYENMNNIFNKICKNENMNFNNNDKNFIINISNNSISTMINCIEKIRLLDNVSGTNIDIKNICTNISYNNFENYFIECKNQNLINALNIIKLLNTTGYTVIDILDNIYLYVNNTIIINEKQKYEIIKVICKYIKVFNNIHENDIELFFFTNNIIKILI